MSLFVWPEPATDFVSRLSPLKRTKQVAISSSKAVIFYCGLIRQVSGNLWGMLRLLSSMEQPVRSTIWVEWQICRVLPLKPQVSRVRPLADYEAYLGIRII